MQSILHHTSFSIRHKNFTTYNSINHVRHVTSASLSNCVPPRIYGITTSFHNNEHRFRLSNTIFRRFSTHIEDRGDSGLDVKRLDDKKHSKLLRRLSITLTGIILVILGLLLWETYLDLQFRRSLQRNKGE